jgi:hypothetical protein
MTDDLVNAAREALAGVTDGPWHVTECGDYWVEHKQPLANPAGFRGVALCGDMEWPHAEVRQIEWKNNARFIALSRSLVPAMAAKIEAQEAEVARLRAELAAAEARAARYKSERDGLERRVTDVQRQSTASEEAERRIVNQREEIKRLHAEVARLKAASVITGPGEAARILLEASGGSMPLEAKMAAVKAVIAREGKCQPARVVQAWQAALEALIDNPGKDSSRDR